jgi:Cu/Ag efflux protein CusF
MKKLMMFIMVLGLTVLAADRTGFSFDNSAAADNITIATSSDVVLGVQSDDGSVCTVYLEITDVGRPGLTGAFAQADIIHQLPDATTLVLLGLGGLLYRRRKE